MFLINRHKLRGLRLWRAPGGIFMGGLGFKSRREVQPALDQPPQGPKTPPVAATRLALATAATGGDCVDSVSCEHRACI
jgi:hypothetical protein